MDYKNASLFALNNDCVPIDSVRDPISDTIRFNFEDLLTSLQESMVVNSADHFLVKLKDIREFVISHTPIFFDIMIKSNLFENLIALCSFDQEISVREYALCCFASIIATIPSDQNEFILAKIIECGYTNIVNLCFINENYCNNQIFLQIYKGIGNLIEKDPKIFLQKIEFDSFYQRAVMIALNRNESISEIMFCFSQIVHFITNLRSDFYLKISELFQIQIQKGISFEKCADGSHKYALNGLFLILKKKSLQNQEKIDLVQKNKLTTLLPRYFEVNDIIEEKIICCQIIQWFYILDIPLDIPFLDCIFWCITNFPKYQKLLLEELYNISFSNTPKFIFYKSEYINILKQIIFDSKFKKKIESFQLYLRLMQLAPNEVLYEMFFNNDTINILFLMLENDYSIYSDEFHNTFLKLIKLSKENDKMNELIEMIEYAGGLTIINEMISSKNIDTFILPRAIILAAELGIS